MNRFNSRSLRRAILRMAYAGSSVHIGCAFSLVEILAVLYRSLLRLGPNGPRSAGRDYLVLSKGHGIMAQYACLHELGWLTDKDLDRYFADGTRLKGLSDAHVPGLEVSSGSLGHGLSVGVGLALAARRAGTDQRCFAIVGDGECNEGSIWEALMLAAQLQLANLIVIVDENRFQAMGPTHEVMNMGSLREKFAAFGLDAWEVAGHEEGALEATLRAAASHPGSRPRAVVAHTIKGKGVSFMEADNRWHYLRLTAATYEQAMAELTQDESAIVPCCTSELATDRRR